MAVCAILSVAIFYQASYVVVTLGPCLLRTQRLTTRCAKACIQMMCCWSHVGPHANWMLLHYFVFQLCVGGNAGRLNMTGFLHILAFTHRVNESFCRLSLIVLEYYIF